MMPKFLPRLERAIDSTPMSDLAGSGPEVGGAAAGEGVGGSRPRSAFAELMSATDATDKGGPGAAPTGVTPATDADDISSRTDMPPEPFAPGFDLPSFLQVLPRSGNEVAVAAAREPGLAAALRRLPAATAGTEARTLDVPDVAIRLPSFLVPPKVDASAVRPAAAAVATDASASVAAASAVTTDAPGEVGAAAPPVAPVAPIFRAASTTTAARSATSALESAIRRTGPGVVPKDNPVAASANASSASTAIAPVLVDPLSQGAGQSSMSVLMPSHPPQAMRPKSVANQAPIDRKGSGPRILPDGGGPRALMRFEPSVLAGTGQRPFETVTAQTGTADRGARPVRTAPGGMEIGPPTTASGVGSAVDAASMSSLTLSDAGDRQNQASVQLRQPVGTEAWQDELSAQLSFMAEQGEGAEAVMKLAPEELGELEVRLALRDGEASLQFGVANSDARQAVEAAQGKLRDLLTSQGLNLSEFNVSSDLSGNTNAESRKGRGASAGQRPAAGTDADMDVAVRPRRSAGVVDLYA